MRIRTVKPEFWTHPVYSRLSDQTKWVAIALLSYADDEGYFYAEPSLVRAAVAPFHDDLAKFSRSLQELVMVGWYDEKESLEMGCIGKIRNWSKHQRVDHAKESKIKTYWDRESVANLSRDPREVLAPEQGTGNREMEQGNISSSASPTTGSASKIETTATLPFDPPSEPVVESKEAEGSAVPLGTVKRSGGDGNVVIKGRTPEEWMAAWNGIAQANGLAVITKLSPKRLANLRARAKDGMLDRIIDLAAEIQASSFLCGAKADWRVDFDWLFGSANNWIKVIEGKYRDQGGARGGAPQGLVRLFCQCGHTRDVDPGMLCYTHECPLCGDEMKKAAKSA